MSITGIEKDPVARTMTVNASFDATIQRVWQLWADPRQLERWWGPPSYPATVTEHDLVPDGRVRYFMTGPEGDRHGGYWRVREVVAPHRLTFVDGFEDDEGAPNPDMPQSDVEVVLARADRGRDGNGRHHHVRVGGGDGAPARDGHGGGHARGHGPDRRPPRRVRHRSRYPDEQPGSQGLGSGRARYAVFASGENPHAR